MDPVLHMLLTVLALAIARIAVTRIRANVPVRIERLRVRHSITIEIILGWRRR